MRAVRSARRRTGSRARRPPHRPPSPAPAIGTPLPEQRTPPDPDALRRRLYRPGADGEDVARYRAALPAPPAPDAPAAPGPPPPRRLPRLLPAAAGALVVAGLVAAVVQTRPAPAPAPSPTAAGTADEGVLPVPAADRARFVQALAGAQPPGVAQYLVLHPSARPRAVAAATRAVVDEHQGVGSLTVPLRPDFAARSGGRITVVLVADRSLPLRWTILREAVRPDHRQYEQTVGQRLLRPEPGALQSATVRYVGAAPESLRVEVRDGMRWDAVVAFTD